MRPRYSRSAVRPGPRQTVGAAVPAAPPMGVVLPFRRRILSGAMTRTTDPSDDHAALILAIAQHRDRAAFAALFAWFAPRVKAWMLRAGAAPSVAEDLAQETLLMVWRKAALFDPARAGAATWIFAIARNLRLDAVRRERHPDELLAEEIEPEPAPAADGAYDRCQAEARIRAALADLPAEQATVIRKAFFEDKAHGEIEKELGIPLGTVKSRLRLAMARLRAALGDVR